MPSIASVVAHQASDEVEDMLGPELYFWIMLPFLLLVIYLNIRFFFMLLCLLIDLVFSVVADSTFL